MWIMNNYPKTLYYMIDILCNEKCSKCTHWKHVTEKQVFDMSKIIKFISDAKSINEFVIVGGEPLIYRNEVKEIIESIPNDIRTTLITNGVLANTDIIDFISKYNVHIIFSIDTIDKNFWKYVRGKDTFDLVMKNLDYAINTLRPEQLSIQSVLSQETAEHVRIVGNWCKEKGIYHSIQDYVQDGFDGQWTEVYNNKVVSDQNCYAYLSNMSILPNGDILTCFQQNLIDGCEKPLGNINQDSFKDIINRDYVHNVLKRMKVCQLPCKVLKCNLESSDIDE